MIIAKKNAAYYFSFAAVDSSTPEAFKTGLTVTDTAYYKDGAGAWTALSITDTFSEIGATGVYEIDLTAAEMNHDKVLIKMTAAGMADDYVFFDLRAKLTDDLNDVAATDIVSSGAITTSGGAISTVTSVTNAVTLPTIPANWITAAGINASALDGKGDWNIGKTGYSLASTGLDAIASTATGIVEIAKAVWDRVLTGGTHNIASSAGRRLRQLQDSGSYNNGGSVVYLDTVNGTAGTTLYENGTLTNAVDTITDAVTLMSNLPANQIFVHTGSTFAPTADFNGYNVFGIGYTTNLGGHDYAGTHIYHSSPINGIATTAGTSDHFDILDSIIDVMTSDDLHFTNCIFIGTCTFGTSGIVSPDVNMNHCKSGIAGASAPVFAKTAGATLTLSVRDWQGGFTLNGLESGDVVTIGGQELGTVTLTGTGGAVEIRGIYKELVTTSYSGTVNTGGAIKGSDIAAILADTGEIGTAGAGLTDLGGMSTAMKAEVLAEVVKLLTTQMTESYAADGVAPTLTQSLMLIQQVLTEFGISGTTNTVKKLDGTTTAATLTLDDATTPTSLTRTT